MNFKKWLLISEAIDANTKSLLAKQKAPKDQLDAFIKELEDEPNLIDKPTAFQRFQTKFVTKKEKPKDEDAQRKHFSTIPNTTEEELQTYDHYKNENKDSLKKMMEQLRKFIDKKIITIKIENNIPVIYRNTNQGSQKLETPDFGRFTSQLDSIQGEITKYYGKGNKPNPLELALSHDKHLIEKGENIWVFKGDRPNICQIIGKNQKWCISSSNSAAHWFTYRINYHQTQYFVFDFNKDEDDPARYVNPGVAPEGMYSEWVDARNTHSKDPEDSESEVGINGYNSINQYKKYLVSKGVPLTTWTTTKPEDWEERLSQYYVKKSFTSAKNDEHLEVFPMYLKIVNRMKDSDFDTLTDDQKKEFILNKIDYLTDKQFAYAIKEFKGEYYNSLGLDGKIEFLGKTNDQEKLLNFAENPNLSDSNVHNLLKHATDKDTMAQIILNKISKLSDDNVAQLLKHATKKDIMAQIILNKNPELSDNNVYNLLDYATEKDIMAQIILNKKPELSNSNVHNLLKHATDKDKMAQIILNKKTELSDNNVHNLLQYAIDKDTMAQIIIEKKPEINDHNVYSLLHYAIDKNKIVKILGTDNISKLSDDSVYSLIYDAYDKQEMAEIIIKYKPEISNKNVADLLQYATDKDKMAQIIIKYKSELTDNNVLRLLDYAIDKDHIAELLQQHTDNISKLSDHNVNDLIIYSKNGQKLAQIINKYHTKKTPEIQELIDKYLHEL